jgi:anti-anti-sigma factor
MYFRGVRGIHFIGRPILSNTRYVLSSANPYPYRFMEETMASLAHREVFNPLVNTTDQPAPHASFRPTPLTYIPTLNVQMAQQSSFILVTLQGELELETLPCCRYYLRHALEMSNTSPIIVDLSECCFVDSQGMLLFINMDRAAREKNNKVIFACPSARLLYVLQRTRLLNLLNIAETMEAAIAMIAPDRK